ncbi:MAG: hypothetical protein AAF985_27080 [Bacteroidota bacterium]
MKPFNRMNIVLVLLIAFTPSCTKNESARNFGGKTTINLPCNTMLFDITWKGNDLWYDYVPMPETVCGQVYEPKNHTFQEKSSYGILDGTVIIIEKRCEK